MNTVSRDVVKAVLETRDHRHNETHAVLLAMFQSLVAELAEQGVLNPRPLAERLALADQHIAEDPNGTNARDMLAHVVEWLNGLEPGLPVAHPHRWRAPSMSPGGNLPATAPAS